MINFLIELIQSAFLIIAAVIIIITAIGILRLDDDMEKVIYVRIHMLSMIDIAAVLAMIGLGQFLLAGIYFVLAPFVAHAMANAYYYGEDSRKYETSDDLTGRIDDNIHNKLAINDNITIDAEFKSNFELGKSTLKAKFESTNDSTEFNNESNEFNNDLTEFNGNVSNESKNSISNELGVVIKEVSTDDIENSSLNKYSDNGDYNKEDNKNNMNKNKGVGGEVHD